MAISPLLKFGTLVRGARATESGLQMFLEGGRDADTFYRQRFAHDKVARSTHGVNCTGSCSWKVYVKDGVITWESQEVDYPSTGADLPDYEPRGCPRGASFSWYEYSPTRIRHPYVRSALLKAWRAVRRDEADPVKAWEKLMADTEAVEGYKRARGKGGLVRVTWDEAMEIVAAANVSTIKNWGPDRVAGFSVLPAMSMISFGAGSRYLQLIGGVNLSFYDWYADLPPASPQVFGDQTDVPEAGDWFNSDYVILWGSNIPLTRTPDAHFMTEARYHGQKVVVVSPDYADSTKFADEWLRVNPGTDAALAQAMGHVILKEFHVERQPAQFLDYMRTYTDSPFLVTLEADESGQMVPGKFLTAGDLGMYSERPNADFRLLVMDEDWQVVDPGGTLADRWGGEAGAWNLRQEGVRSRLSLYVAGGEVSEVKLPRFDLVGAETGPQSGALGAGYVTRGVPVRRVGEKLVTTVYDLLLAQYGVGREGLPGTWPAGYDDATTPGTPGWATEITGVPAAAIERMGREFAQSALDSGGRSMIIMGAGVNHYFHADTIYRTFLALTTMCGTQGINGGGWAHYVGQEKVRPHTGWAQYSFALDWQRPARQMISTGFWYLNTDQWRYDGLAAERLAAAGDNRFQDLTAADTLVEAMQRGWMPSYPTFDRSSLQLGAEAAAAGKEAAQYVAEELAAGRLHFACENPDAPENFPRILFNWRTNLMGSSAKGAEYFHRHLFGADDDIQTPELEAGERPVKIAWPEKAPRGKLDLVVSADFRNTTTTLLSDVVLPAATWYEKYDLSSTDMHPYVHPFTPAIDPPWEAHTDFAFFQDLARRVSDLAPGHLATATDVLAVPLGHDTPDEMALVHGRVEAREECGWIPGKNMPKIVPIERDYRLISEKFNAMGPVLDKMGMNTKGVPFNAEVTAREVERFGQRYGMIDTAIGPRPRLDDDKIVAEMILSFSGTTNGEMAFSGFSALDKQVGSHTAELAEGSRDRRITLEDTIKQPQPVITSPEWSGSEHGGRRYSAFAINVEHHKPWHTLSGRQHYYLDHDWIQSMGEQMPLYRPPLDLRHLYGESGPGELSQSRRGGAEVTVRYLTPHNKWSIHSQYFDNLHMLTLGRGGQVVWMSPADAEKIGVRDNDWIEARNRNGVVSARAVVSHRIPEGTVFMYHAQERVAGTPLTESTGKRGGSHNSLTRIFLKPSHLIGGYGQFSYGFNYYGPTGNQRDEVTTIRRRAQEVEF